MSVIRDTIHLIKPHITGNSIPDQFILQKLEIIKTQADRIEKLREEFLRLNQNWESRVEKTNIHLLISKKGKELLQSFTDITLIIDLIESIKNIKTDASAINACLEILLRNSIDEFQKGQGNKELRVSLRPVDKSEIMYLGSSSAGLAIDVEDNGPGVPPEIKKDMFNLIRSSKAKGLGLGLVYCRKLARSAKGDVYYHEEFPNGAKFTLVFPYE